MHHSVAYQLIGIQLFPALNYHYYISYYQLMSCSMCYVKMSPCLSFKSMMLPLETLPSNRLLFLSEKVSWISLSLSVKTTSSDEQLLGEVKAE